MSSNPQNFALELDKKYQQFFKDMKGWKVLPDGLVHKSDRMLEGVKTMGRNGQVRYSESRVRVALFGLGNIGTVHLECIIHNPKVKLLYCVESVQERINYMQYRWNLGADVKMLHPKDDYIVFQDPQIDAVIIGTPTPTHGELIKKALKHGKAVFCEKPLADDYALVKECLQAALYHGLPLFCAFNRRFDPTFRLIHDRVHNGDIGQLQIIKMTSRDCPPPPISYIKTTKGIFHDMAIHDFDLLLWMTGELPNMVSATGTSFMEEFKELNDYDTAAVVMKFPSGTIGMIDLSRNAAYGYDQRIEVFGNKGMLSNSNPKPSEVSMESSIGSIKVPNYYSFVSRFSESYPNELNHFADCVRGHSEVDTKPWEILASCKLAEACTESARSEKPIQLKWDEAWFTIAKFDKKQSEE